MTLQAAVSLVGLAVGAVALVGALALGIYVILLIRNWGRSR